MTSSVKRAKSLEAAVDKTTSEPRRRRASFHLLKVCELDRITDDAVAITFAVPDHLKGEFTYKPGQHVAVRATVAGDDVRRNYSICSPVSSGKLRIGVKRLPDGVFSNFALERLRVGDALEVLSPAGLFVVEPDPARARNYGAVAAGSGITPILSIIASTLEVESDSQVTLIYLNTSIQSIMFLEELEDLKNRYLDRLQVFYVLARERQESDILSGRLDSERLAAILDGFDSAGVDNWYLCGPRPLTDMVRDTLLARGARDACIHRELFHAAASPPRKVLPKTGEITEGYDVTVQFDGRATTFKLPPNTETILDGGLTLRSELPYACKNGICGTCRCRVTDGEVEMVQNFALEPDEVAAGYVLACQSYPTTPKVAIDFDQ